MGSMMAQEMSSNWFASNVKLAEGLHTIDLPFRLRMNIKTYQVTSA